MLLPTPVVISSYTDGTSDAHGVPARTFTDQLPVNGRLQQIAGTEVTAGVQETVADWLLFLPAGTVLDARDRVKALGLVLEVVGPPARIVGRYSEHHVEAKLRSVGD
jgi:hypothetical protein